MRSMLAPLSAIRPATAAMCEAFSGEPMTVTCERPGPRTLLSPVPRSISTCIPSSRPVASTASRSFFQSRGMVTRTPRISRRRSTICSMSTTSTPARDRVVKIVEVTPGRSLPVSVISSVSGRGPRWLFIAGHAIAAHALSVAGRSVADMSHEHHSIDYVEIYVDDIPAAKEFYAAAFGWRFNDYGDAYAGIQAADGDGEVGGITTGDQRGGSPLVLVISEDLEASLHAGQGAGAAVVEGPFDYPGGRRVPLPGPAGHPVRGGW